jgi:dTDP-glucose pyrophosphorylase
LQGSRASEIIGLIPAAGRATRLGPLPCSKEVYPIGLQELSRGLARPKVAMHYLLEKMRAGGVKQACIVLLHGKWDIPAYFGDGSIVDMEIVYRVLDRSPSPPYTLDRAYPFTCRSLVAFGFPDILFRTSDAYSKLLSRQRETNADVVLGAFRTEETYKWDMLELDADGRVRGIDFKPARTALQFSWSIAVWSPVFSEFMHEFVATHGDEERELIVGDVMLAAIKNHLNVQTVVFPGDTCLDIGTPEDLVKAIREGCQSE